MPSFLQSISAFLRKPDLHWKTQLAYHWFWELIRGVCLPQAATTLQVQLQKLHGFPLLIDILEKQCHPSLTKPSPWYPYTTITTPSMAMVTNVMLHCVHWMCNKRVRNARGICFLVPLEIEPYWESLFSSLDIGELRPQCYLVNTVVAHLLFMAQWSLWGQVIFQERNLEVAIPWYVLILR